MAAKSPRSKQGRPSRFDSFERKAGKIVESSGRVQRLVKAASSKLSGLGGEKFQALREQLGLALSLVKAWMSGEYREVSKSTIVTVVAALLYFVVPLDVIPDFLFGWGFIDDIAVVSYAFGQVSDEFEKYKQWLATQNVDEAAVETETDLFKKIDE